MKITGTVCTIGELDESDALQVAGVPALQIRMDDGRIVTLTGLTREECREACPRFMERVALTLGDADLSHGDEHG